MRSDAPTAAGVGLLPVATLVLWAGCLAVGVVGLRLRYPRATPPPREPEPVDIQALNVDVTNGPAPPPPQAVPEARPTPPAAAEASPVPPPAAPAVPAPASAPPLAAVAAPSSAVAFAVPVDGPSRVVEPKQAAPPTDATRAPVTAMQAPAAPQRLTFGEGEGRQPAPEYPREAALAHQQGTVVVRFTVDADGRVRQAEASVPCGAPLLNQAAVRAVRETWRFPRGPVRNYEVAIEFELRQH